MVEPPPFRDALRAMDAGDPATALGLLKALVALEAGKRRIPAPLRRESRHPLLRLLERRGYFIKTERQLASSLEEIRAIGPGFDLYEICRILARLDRDSAGPGRRRAIPELENFLRPDGAGDRELT